MKKQLIIAVLCTAVASTAAGAGTEGHGGDIQCDARIKAIAGDISSWIAAGGPEIGKLDLSSSRNQTTSLPFTWSEYDAAMTTLLNLPLDISCVSQGDPRYPVKVDGATKVCKNTVDSRGLHMVCDRGLFMGFSDELQYQQIHHEFATDVPGLEPDYGPLSSYKISLQISAHLRQEVIKKLAVSPPASDTFILKPRATDSCDWPVSTFRILNSMLAETNVPINFSVQCGTDDSAGWHYSYTVTMTIQGDVNGGYYGPIGHIATNSCERHVAVIRDLDTQLHDNSVPIIFGTPASFGPPSCLGGARGNNGNWYPYTVPVTLQVIQSGIHHGR